MIAALSLPEALREQLEKDALAAFPEECCGLIEGKVEGRAAFAQALHPMRNTASMPDSFAIDPVAHIALHRRLRERGAGTIGCYHTHPNGKAEPSLRDQAQASEIGFVWLIAACNGLDCAVGAFVFDGNEFMPVQMERC